MSCHIDYHMMMMMMMMMFLLFGMYDCDAIGAKAVYLQNRCGSPMCEAMMSIKSMLLAVYLQILIPYLFLALLTKAAQSKPWNSLSLMFFIAPWPSQQV